MLRCPECVVRVVLGIEVCLGADLALLFGSGRGLHHRNCVAAIVMSHNGGRSGLLISRKMNPPICVACDPTPRRTIGGEGKKVREGGGLRAPFLDPPLQGSKVGRPKKQPTQPKKGPFNDEN